MATRGGKWVPDDKYGQYKRRVDTVISMAADALLRGWEEEQRVGHTYWMDYEQREAHLTVYDKKMALLCGYWPPNMSYYAESKEGGE